MKDPFWTLHQGLDREGPGEPADVRWTAQVVGLRPDARICDAACGPGADVPVWLELAPEGHVTAVDRHKPFIDELWGRVGPDKRVTAFAGNMLKIKGPFDVIWCAGAVYFVGVRKALLAWRPALAPGGAVAFSEPCMFTDNPSLAARALWGGYEAKDADGIDAMIRSAGYRTLATRRLSDAAWEAYYTPLEQRIALLRPNADELLAAVLDAAQAEINAWRRHKDETGYLLSVVRPE